MCARISSTSSTHSCGDAVSESTDASERDDAPAGARVVEALPWQRDAIRDLLVRRGRWPHAMLIAGAPGIGKRVLARTLARSLLCETPRADGSACGACASCRYEAAGQHPDLRLVEPVEIDDDVAKPVEWISVAMVRALADWTQLSSHRGGAKVAVITPAERMNASAANALLKTLEEPPAQTYFLLVSDLAGRLRATILSRCQRIVAPRPDVEAARAWLGARGIADVNGVLAQAANAPLRALDLADPEYQAERRTWLSALAVPRALAVTALAARIEAVPREARKDRLAAVIDWLVAWCADLARVRCGGTPVANADFEAPLRSLVLSVAALRLFRYHRSLLNQRMLVSHPLQPRLVAEALLIDYRALFI
jgi:DNA polymerase-3 subunit delta'